MTSPAITNYTMARPRISSIFQVEDTRPQTSPYESPPVTVEFRSDAAAYIPRQIVDKYPALSSRVFQNCDISGNSTSRLDLNHLSSEAVHVLLHFLFTNTYECLRPVGESVEDKAAWELKVAIEVANSSRRYDMHELSRLADLEIQKLGDKLAFPHLIGLIEQSGQISNSLCRSGVSSYVQSRVRVLCHDLGNLLAIKLGSDLGTPNAKSKTVLQSLVTLRNSLQRGDSGVESSDEFDHVTPEEHASSLLFPETGGDLGKSNVPPPSAGTGEGRPWAGNCIASSSQAEPARINQGASEGFLPFSEEPPLPVTPPKSKKELKKEKKKQKMLAERAQTESWKLSLPLPPMAKESK